MVTRVSVVIEREGRNEQEQRSVVTRVSVVIAREGETNKNSGQW